MIKTLSKDVLKQLFNAIDKNNPVGARLYCILLLLIDTGARISEVAGVLMSNLHLQECTVLVVGKGQKERLLPFSPLTRKELINFIKRYRSSLCQSESIYLFPRKDGSHVTVNSIQQAIRRLAAKAGLQDIRCYAHLFRHTFGTRYIAKGGSELILKEIMGHESMVTTQKYTHFQPEDLQKHHWKYSPINDLFGK